ncbi:MAG TPA: transposase [Candidatus Tectomicrobia bacterium]
MKAYSVDLRAKILRACDQQFGSQRAIATMFGVSHSCVEKLLRRRRRTGSIAPRPHAGGRRASCDEAALSLVRRAVQTHPDATLAELCTQLVVQRGLRVSVSTMSRLALQLGLPRKKSHSTPANGTPRASGRRGRTTTR